jgi:hypothetical protein
VKLFELVIAQAAEGMATDDLKLLLSMTVSAEPDLCMGLLALVRSIVKTPGAVVAHPGESGLFWTALTSLMPQAQPQQFIQLVEVLIELHGIGAIRGLTRTLHAELLIYEMTPALTCTEVLNYLIVRINEDALWDFVPLACFIAMNMSDDDAAELVSRPITSQSYRDFGSRRSPFAR